MTAETEKRVREAAAALHDAIAAARSEGLAVTWPRTVDDLPSIAVSETAKKATVKNVDGSPLEREADGTLRGEPLNLSNEERAKLPKLDAAASNDPSTFVRREGLERRGK